jgi:hypothetical protein
VQRGGHERLARARGGVEDDVLPLEQLEDGLLLRRVEAQPPARDELEEAPEQLVRVGVSRREEVVKRPAQAATSTRSDRASR